MQPVNTRYATIFRNRPKQVEATVQAMIEAQNDDTISTSERSSPSEQELWDSEENDSDAVDMD
jgi:hypothetical protein